MTRNVFNVSLLRKDGSLVDTTQIDERDPEFANDLFYNEFNIERKPGDKLQWEETFEEIEE